MAVLAGSRLECIRGKDTFTIDAAGIAALARGRAGVLLDIGTGDGRYPLQVARTRPEWLVIGLDACREGLREGSRRAPRGGNAIFVVANALALPPALAGLATRVTINFPWGSLLAGLLDGDPALLDGLRAVSRPGAALDCRLNGGALAEAGWSLGEGGARLRRVLRGAGFGDAVGCGPLELDAAALRACPSTWARRLAHGRDPRAISLSFVRRG